MHEFKQTDHGAWKYDVNYHNRPDFWLAMIGCSHIDAKDCARSKLKSIFDLAVERDGRIIFNGDNNDLMQGRNDPRRAFGAMRKEWLSTDTKKTSYINCVINDTVEFLKPYANHIDLFGLGNHETSAMKNLDVDVTSLIAEKLSGYADHKIHVGGIEGFIRCAFYYKSPSMRSRGSSASRTILFKHDGGSCGKRSKGILAYDLLAAEYQNTDIFVTAHTHDMLMHATQNTVLGKGGKEEYQKRYYCQGPSFKESWADPNKLSWWTATNKGARAVGAWMLQFNVKKNSRGPRPEIKFRAHFED